jgi:hypothetical protein
MTGRINGSNGSRFFIVGPNDGEAKSEGGGRSLYATPIQDFKLVDEERDNRDARVLALRCLF